MKDAVIGGLVAGLIVAILIVAFRSFWLRVVVPWFEDRVYKDVKIEGKWFGVYTGNVVDYRRDVISLTRQGHAVSGTLTCVNGPEEGETYELRGSFRNLILSLTYETKDASKSDRGAITLKTVRNAERMKGKIALYHTQSDAILALDILWFRHKEDLETVLTELIEASKTQATIEIHFDNVGQEAGTDAVTDESDSENTEEAHVLDETKE